MAVLAINISPLAPSIEWETRSQVRYRSTVFSLKPITAGHHQDKNAKKKAVFIMGTTATGKSKLSVDLATHFNGEIINADKIQVYRGLTIAGNRITEPERNGVPHHLLEFVDSDADYTHRQFCEDASSALDHVTNKGRVPFLVGCSNTYIEGLVEDTCRVFDFKARFETCFLWVDVAIPLIYRQAARRVEKMVAAGLIEEIREAFTPKKDTTRGVWRTVGFAEIARYLEVESAITDGATRKMVLDGALREMAENTCKLVDIQLGKIHRLRDELGWELHRIDATPVYEGSSEGDAEEVWKKAVWEPSLAIVSDFLEKD